MSRYLMLDNVQEPFELPLDETARAVWAFNASALKVNEDGDEFADEIAKKLEDDGVGTRNTNIFVGKASRVPTDGSPYITILVTPGGPPLKIHNQTAPAYTRPQAEIVARAKKHTEARTLIYAAYNSLVAVSNQTLTAS